MLGHRNISPLSTAFAYVVLDGFCVTVSYLFASWVTLPPGIEFRDHAWGHAVYWAVFLAVWYCAAMDQRLITSRRGEDLLPQLFSVTIALLVLFTVGTFWTALVFGRPERDFIIVLGLGIFISILFFRSTVRLSLWGLRSRGYNSRRILIIGANESTAQLVDTIRGHEQYGYNIEGILEDESDRMALFEGYDIPYLGKIEELEDLLSHRVIDEVYISLPVRSLYESIQAVAHLCEGVGVPVRLIADLFPLRTASSFLQRLEDIPLLSLAAIPGTQVRPAVKRFEDWVLSTLLLIALSPLFLSIAVLVKLDSRGPVFTRRAMVGRNHREFSLLGFRCTVAAAESESGEPVLTRVGKRLRRYNLDELPQLINVWLGHMSARGPRPADPSSIRGSRTGRQHWRGFLDFSTAIAKASQGESDGATQA